LDQVTFYNSQLINKHFVGTGLMDTRLKFCQLNRINSDFAEFAKVEFKKVS